MHPHHCPPLVCHSLPCSILNQPGGSGGDGDGLCGTAVVDTYFAPIRLGSSSCGSRSSCCCLQPTTAAPTNTTTNGATEKDAATAVTYAATFRGRGLVGHRHPPERNPNNKERSEDIVGRVLEIPSNNFIQCNEITDDAKTKTTCETRAIWKDYFDWQHHSGTPTPTVTSFTRLQRAQQWIAVSQALHQPTTP
jgi:hypothetical protein